MRNKAFRSMVARRRSSARSYVASRRGGRRWPKRRVSSLNELEIGARSDGHEQNEPLARKIRLIPSRVRGASRFAAVRFLAGFAHVPKLARNDGAQLVAQGRC